MESIREIYREYPIGFTLVMIGIILFNIWTSPVFWGLMGSQDIKRKPLGEHCYYVVVQEHKSTKSYTIPGKIEKSEDGYHIVNVYWPNGGYLYFEDMPLCEVDKECSAFDQNGRDWDLKLTNNKAEHADVQDADAFTASGIFWFVFWIVLPAGLLLICVFKKEKE